MELKQLREERDQMVAELKAERDRVFAADHDATDEELTEIDNKSEAVQRKNKLIATLDGVESVSEAPTPRRTSTPNQPGNTDPEPDDGTQPSISVGASGIERDPKRGFSSFGEYAGKLVQASVGRSEVDPRLYAASPTNFANETSGADGGYLVPPEFSREIFNLSLGEDSLIPFTDNTEVSGNGMSFPADETTPWGTSGVSAYWTAEAGTVTQSKPVLQTRDLKLNKLNALVPMTDELIADTSALETYVRDKVAEAIRWKHNEAIINGTGNGQPLGFRQATDSSGNDITVEVAKKSGQTADTIVAENISQLWSQRIPGPLTRVVWMAHPSAFTQLATMTIGNQPVWLPPSGDLRSAPNGRMFGRPLILTQQLEKLGDDGDIILFDGRGYKTITKSGGIDTATSIHLFFDSNATAFRATFRIDGQPMLASRVAPPTGNLYMSHFLEIANRA